MGDQAIQYRAEIDGLRAIAVLPVILFHAGIAGFGGGFVGVDIFFVISGYLITSILWSDLQRGSFSFKKFYERRARRILPALLFVIICTLAVGWLSLPPDRFENLGKSALAAIFSVSNVYFWKGTGYFEAAAESQPLLHTWSLGVEEQFYIFFPILLLFLHRNGNRLLTAIALGTAALASLLLTEWGWRNAPGANFYLAPSRVWELMAGALCALYLYSRKVEHRGNDVLAIAGLLMIAVSITAYSEETPFPSLATLLPVIGTVLVILFAQQSNLAVRALSLRPFVGLGLISYSAYLWHQPVFALSRNWMVSEPSTTVMLLLSILSIGLAILSWRFIEMPFRTRKPTEKKGLSFGVPTIAWLTATAAVFALVIAVNQGMPHRVDAQRLSTFEAQRAFPSTLWDCRIDFEITELQVCKSGNRDAPILRIALIGDSHAAQWAETIGELASANNWSLDTYAKSSCPVAVVKFRLAAIRRDYSECTTWRNALFDELTDEGYDLVIITQSTLGYLEHNGRHPITREAWKGGLAQLAGILDNLPGRWILLTDNPQFRQRDPAECFGQMWLMKTDDISLCDHRRAEAIDEKSRDLERAVVAESSKGDWRNFTARLCDGEFCRPRIGDALVMSDSNHLSLFGTRQFTQEISEAIRQNTASDSQID